MSDEQLASVLSALEAADLNSGRERDAVEEADRRLTASVCTPGARQLAACLRAARIELSLGRDRHTSVFIADCLRDPDNEDGVLPSRTPDPDARAVERLARTHARELVAERERLARDDRLFPEHHNPYGPSALAQIASRAWVHATRTLMLDTVCATPALAAELAARLGLAPRFAPVPGDAAELVGCLIASAQNHDPASAHVRDALRRLADARQSAQPR